MNTTYCSKHGNKQHITATPTEMGHTNTHHSQILQSERTAIPPVSYPRCYTRLTSSPTSSHECLPDKSEQPTKWNVNSTRQGPSTADINTCIKATKYLIPAMSIHIFTHWHSIYSEAIPRPSEYTQLCLYHGMNKFIQWESPVWWSVNSHPAPVNCWFCPMSLWVFLSWSLSTGMSTVVQQGTW